MKLYLSYPMTAATENDKLRREQVRRVLKAQNALKFYDPETMEPAGLSMAEIQDWDFEQMRSCGGLLVIWSSGTGQSGGVLEEIGWARRIFHIPVVVFRPDPHHRLSAWTFCSVSECVKEDLTDCLRLLTTLMLAYSPCDSPKP